MPNTLEGRVCLVRVNGKQERAKIVKVFSKVGFDNHGETYVSVVLENIGSIWSGDRSYKLRDVELLEY